ncbi:WD40-repeat-containing domain protein [Mycena capillaripes]|nr:WD40-repeat-containing domain protein [Mycena capillaripes]
MHMLNCFQANILIDNAGIAVLCDFGLSRVKADMTTRTGENDVDLGSGSRNWMSPERLRGALPKKASDIYAFGITTYELFANEIPLGHILPQDLRYLVVNEDLRPHILGVDDTSVMPQEIWAIAVKCWVKIPDDRPTANHLCDILMEHGSATSSIQPFLAVDGPQRQALQVQLALKNSFTECSTASHSLAYSPNGKLLCSGSTDGMVWVWDVQTGKTLLHQRTHITAILCVSFSADGQRIAAASNDIHVWDLISRQNAFPDLVQHSRPVWSIAFSADGRRLVSGSADNTAIIWNAETGEKQATLSSHTRAVRVVAFSPDSTRVITGSWDHTLRVWDAATAECMLTLREHTGEITCAVFSPDAMRIASCAWAGDSMIRIWDAKSGRASVAPFKASSQKMQSLAYSRDGQWIVTGDWQHQLQVLDARTGRSIWGPTTTSSTIYCVALSPDGSSLAVGSEEAKLNIYSVM